MGKTSIKTIKNLKSVTVFLDNIEDLEKKHDAKKILSLMKKVTGEKPIMWGNSIVGFGNYHYKYDSGREGDSFIIGFSPRKQNLTIYIMPGYQDYQGIIENLGPHSVGKSCLYIKRLNDIRISVLKKLIKKGYEDMKNKYK